MKPYDVQTLCAAMGGTLVAGDGAALTGGGVSTDTRSVKSGDLFVALVGERFDAHDFLAKAVEGGAAALVVSRVPKDFEPGEAAVIKVADTLMALQRLARWYRDQLDVAVVGITGSNGKTTTKDFTSAVLRQRYAVNATRGNLNNHIGLPLTILDSDEEDEVLVLEMGMNHSGEIAPLCEVARPHLGIITNIGTAHIEFLGSREAIAEEKGALARALPEVGTLIVTAGCEYADYFRTRTHARTVAVGNGRGAVRAEGLRMDADGTHFELVIDGVGQAPVALDVTGRHMVNNALLGAAAGWALGLSLEEIVAGLQRADITSGRLRRFEAQGITVFDDTYNANPESVRAAIDTLAEQPLENGNTRTVVLGMMAELGSHGAQAHREVGEHAARLGLQVVSVGSEATGIKDGALRAGASEARHFDDYDEAVKWLQSTLHAGDYVLFKGSRSAAVERIMNAIFPEN